MQTTQKKQKKKLNLHNIYTIKSLGIFKTLFL